MACMSHLRMFPVQLSLTHCSTNSGYRSIMRICCCCRVSPQDKKRTSPRASPVIKVGQSTHIMCTLGGRSWGVGGWGGRAAQQHIEQHQSPATWTRSIKAPAASDTNTHTCTAVLTIAAVAQLQLQSAPRYGAAPSQSTRHEHTQERA